MAAKRCQGARCRVTIPSEYRLRANRCWTGRGGRPINDLVMNPAPAPAMHPSATIERVETVLLDLPTIRPHRLSVAPMNGQTLLLVRIHCTDGMVGVGEGIRKSGV